MNIRKRFVRVIVKNGNPSSEDIRILKQVKVRRRFMKVNETYDDAFALVSNITAY